MPSTESSKGPGSSRRRGHRQPSYNDIFGGRYFPSKVAELLGVTLGDFCRGGVSGQAFSLPQSGGLLYPKRARVRAGGDAQAVPSTPARPKPQPVDSFVSCLHETYAGDGENPALDYVYAVFHPLVIKDREYDRASRILSQVRVDELPSSVLIGLLMTTYAHKTSVTARKEFLAKAKARIAQLADGAELLPYLADLE